MSVAPAAWSSSMIFDAPFFNTKDWTATTKMEKNRFKK